MSSITPTWTPGPRGFPRVSMSRLARSSAQLAPQVTPRPIFRICILSTTPEVVRRLIQLRWYVRSASSGWGDQRIFGGSPTPLVWPWASQSPRQNGGRPNERTFGGSPTPLVWPSASHSPRQNGGETHELEWLTKERRKTGTEIPVFRLSKSSELGGSLYKKPPSRSLTSFGTFSFNIGHEAWLLGDRLQITQSD